jgi:hypothetical protein
MPINRKPIIVILWYRVSGSSIDLFNHLDHLLQVVESEGKEYILMGDLNCDLLTSSPHCYTIRLKTICYNYNLVQLITKPTRITEKSKTLIDLIYCTDPSKICVYGVIHVGISDHSLTYAIWGKNKKNCNEPANNNVKNINTKHDNHSFRTSRSYKKFNETKFLNDLAQTNWDNVYNTGNVNTSAELFEQMFLNVINRHAPFKKTENS